ALSGRPERRARGRGPRRERLPRWGVHHRAGERVPSRPRGRGTPGSGLARMSDHLGITLEQMVSGLKARRTRIPAEIGAYVALEVAEHLMRGPARATPSDIRIGDDGTVSLFVTPNTADEDAAAQSVIEVLATTLVAAGTGVPNVLIRLVEEKPPSGPGCLALLTSELESSLVPLNRAAARRVLSRMTRDAKRPRTDRPPAGSGTLDDAL